MIPKIIHYCWLSNDPIPEFLKKCMASWKEKLPDYQFYLWNLNRFDIESSKWVKQAFNAKKYAFAADYIRLYALYNYGGFYLDMDVEILKPFDDLLDLNNAICFENSRDKRLEVAAFGVERHSCWVKCCLDEFDKLEFIDKDGHLDTKVLPMRISNILREHNISISEAGDVKEVKELESYGKIGVLTFDYFSPKSYGTGKIEKSLQTYSIHHFSGSWLPLYAKIEKTICQFLGLPYKAVLQKITEIKL